MTIVYLLAGASPLLALGFSSALFLQRVAWIKTKLKKTPPAS